MKAIKKILDNLLWARPKKAFYLKVRCSDCGEEVRVRINRASDFQVEYSPHNPEHRYTIKREIIGKDCFNLMGLTLALKKDVKVLYVDTKGCEFVEFCRE